ncbi:ABC transporter ATP-binding protein [Cucumibacter marinus]|uniref:ABC transporter ATP-binding protein n=1 Tax=Cucumibacter marinus TaxID=1121252 RepID=UPI00041A02DD|nr:ABC transporter ATP-binding protein [Cucumibacter marinus]
MFLDIRNLQVTFQTETGAVRAVNDLSLSLDRGKTLAIVGESGSGKTAAALSIMGLHGSSARIGGSIKLDDQELVGADDETFRRLRGDKVAMIFQDPLTAMHPHHRIGDQIAEAYQAHYSAKKQDVRRLILDMLDRVGMTDPKRVYASYPFELSGGMRQRAMIAMSLVCNPDLLIADEPTTALDVTIQAQIIDLLADLQKEFNSAVILVTHDLGVVAEFADDVVVMYCGRAVESGQAEQIFDHPGHPYTQGLLASVPRLDQERGMLVAIPGTPPNAGLTIEGCPFAPRCSRTQDVADDLCRSVLPPLVGIEDAHTAACHLAANDAEGRR